MLVTPWTSGRQVLLSIGFSRQEYWSGLSFPSPGELPNPGTEPISLGSPVLLTGGFFTREANKTVGCPFPSPGDLPDSGIEPASTEYPSLAGGFITTNPS